MKKIVFLTTRAIYPITGGREVVLYNYCKGLKEFYNCEISLISFIDDKTYYEIPNFIKEQYIIKQPNIFEKIKNVFIKSFITRKWPMQVSLYYCKKTQKKVDEIISRINPDILICDMARTAEYIKENNLKSCRRVLDMDDLLSKRYFRQAMNSNGKNILGQYSKKVPKFLLKFLSLKKLKNFILLFEGNLLEKYEKNIAKYFDDIIFVSPEECSEFNKVINSNKSIFVTIGVDNKYYYLDKRQDRDSNLIGFLGNMNVPHNQDSVDYFLENIFPEIKRYVPRAKLRVIGKCTDSYKNRFWGREDVEVTGEVSDIRPYMQECNVSVAWLTYGSGIKTKILETMAMGIPVVTNDIGAEGIMVKSGFDIYISNNNIDFAKRVVSLLVDKKLNENIRLNAKRTIDDFYTWENTMKNMNNVFEELELNNEEKCFINY